MSKIAHAEAFPNLRHQYISGPGGLSQSSMTTAQGGMTYRQWLVGQIATGALQQEEKFTTASVAGACVQIADAIIAELEKGDTAHEDTRYLPIDCPKCGRMRLEYSLSTRRVKCEKCGARWGDDEPEKGGG